MKTEEELKVRIEFPVKNKEEFKRLKSASKLPDETWYLINDEDKEQ